MQNSVENTSVLEFLFNKVADLQNFEKLLRTPFLRNTAYTCFCTWICKMLKFLSRPFVWEWETIRSTILNGYSKPLIQSNYITNYLLSQLNLNVALSFFLNDVIKQFPVKKAQCLLKRKKRKKTKKSVLHNLCQWLILKFEFP